MSDHRPDELSMTVSAKDIYDKVTEVASDVRDIKESRADHETRIRALERWRYGVAAALVAAGAALARAKGVS